MKLNKKQGLFLKQTIEHWQLQGTITPDVANELNQSFSIRPFDWERLAKYSFWISMICTVIAIAAITLDDYFLQLRNIVDGELTVRTLQERIDDYNADDSWNESVDA